VGARHRPVWAGPGGGGAAGRRRGEPLGPPHPTAATTGSAEGQAYLPAGRREPDLRLWQERGCACRGRPLQMVEKEACKKQALNS
jgi:hypothetical protein